MRSNQPPVCIGHSLSRPKGPEHDANLSPQIVPILRMSEDKSRFRIQRHGLYFTKMILHCWPLVTENFETVWSYSVLTLNVFTAWYFIKRRNEFSCLTQFSLVAPPWWSDRYTAFGMWWHTVTHGRENWRMEGETSTLTPPRQVVYPILLPLMRTPRLPAVDWTDSPADLNGLVRLDGRQNVVSAHVPSGSARALPV